MLNDNELIIFNYFVFFFLYDFWMPVTEQRYLKVVPYLGLVQDSRISGALQMEIL